ncbi:MAG: RnfABCDGE type electron transport complex subunit D [Lentisphaerae bacterium]|nr:RnfABCDGE type electron transport complex subunit D [Lentisphaerota bacterium]
MKRVLLALTPIVLASIHFFGWRVLVMLAIACAAGFLTEYAFVRRWGQSVSSAVFVTCFLYVLSLPPNLPMWMVAVGIVVAVLFGKMVFGGFGRNVFNPALTGRAFLYASFGGHMTASWVEPVGGPAGGWGAYAADAVTRATPGMLMKDGVAQDIVPLLTGATSGTVGGTTALLAILGGLYLVWTKAANYRIVVSAWAAFFVTQTALWLAGVQGAGDPLHTALGGSIAIGLFFYATDPVSAAQTNPGRWIYGAFIGAMSPVISVFSAWPAGTMFAILLANMFAPITDHAIRAVQKKGRA